MSPRGRPARQAERAAQILDAAAELLLRYGYDKMTIDDIARSAGVAKGTIYLHWSTRELLFLALLRRERAALLGEVRDRVADAATPDLRLLLTEMVRAYRRRPLLIAVLTRDADVLGKLSRTANAEGSVHRGIVGHLETLRAGGWIRTDQSLAEQVTVLSAVFLGFFAVEPLMPAEFTLTAATSGSLLANTVVGAVQRVEPLSRAEVAAVAAATREFLDGAVDEAEARLHTTPGATASGRSGEE